MAEARYRLYTRKHGKPLRIMALPPTSQNLLFHILRALYAVILAKAADKEALPPLDLCDFGWEMKEGAPVPATSKGPTGPQARIDVIVCGCAADGKACNTQSCSCHRERVSCTIVCKCISGANGHNPYKVEEEEDDKQDEQTEQETLEYQQRMDLENEWE